MSIYEALLAMDYPYFHLYIWYPIVLCNVLINISLLWACEYVHLMCGTQNLIQLHTVLFQEDNGIRT